MPSKYAQEPTTTEAALIEMSLNIGSIADSNRLFTKGIAQYIESIGKPLDEITLTELCELLAEYREAFNHPNPPAKKTSKFNVLDKAKNLIAESVPFDQAKPLSEHIVGSVIKFDRMGGVA